MKTIIAGLSLLAAVLLALEWTFNQGAETRSYVYFDDMYRSVAYKSQSVNPFLPGERTHQEPVPGTIARGYMPLRYGPSVEEGVRAGEEPVNPHTSNPARGQQTYQTFCAPCHGPGGAGDGVVTRRGYPPPPSLLTGLSPGMKDGQLYHIITYGYKNMPGYGGLVDREDRWSVIDHVRQLQTAATPSTQEAPDDTLKPSL